MTEDLQGLLEKINRDGVEKANAEAARIVEEARAKAAAIVKAANEEAAKAKADAENDAAGYAERAKTTIAQAARDTVIMVGASVESMLKKLLEENVDKTLADPKNVAALTLEAVKGLTGEAEVAVPPALAATLKAQLASQKNVTVVTDETLGTGFSVMLEGRRVERAFTGEAIAAELAKRLRPDLAKLVKA
jgi:V/A-type H+-transporting ATPase subunit E